mgnify:CR=1 FL=1
MKKNDILVFEGFPCIVNAVSEEGVLTVQEYNYVEATHTFVKQPRDYELPAGEYPTITAEQLKARFSHVVTNEDHLGPILDGLETAAVNAEPEKTLKATLMDETKDIIKDLAAELELIDDLKFKAIKGKENTIDFILENKTEEEIEVALAAVKVV